MRSHASRQKLKRAYAFEREQQAKGLATYKAVGDRRYRAQIAMILCRVRRCHTDSAGRRAGDQALPRLFERVAYFADQHACFDLSASACCVELEWKEASTP